MKPFATYISILSLLLALPAAAQKNASLQLVAARDHIEGSFLVPNSIYADRERIYLASFQGKLFVLARDRSANFPLLETVSVSDQPLTSVSGDEKKLYVTAANGILYVYTKSFPLGLVQMISLSTGPIGSLAILGARIFVSTGQANSAVDRKRLYLSQLNEGEVGKALSKSTLLPIVVYGNVFQQNSTVEYNARTGARIDSIPNPTDLLGRPSQPNLYADDHLLIQTTPGCCGTGIFIYDERTLALEQYIPRTFTNVVQIMAQHRWLLAGSEGGWIDVIDLKERPSSIVSTLNLRELTGHTGSEDIEVRALWADDYDNLVFAGSSWGNDQSRSPLLPSFFVVELVTKKH